MPEKVLNIITYVLIFLKDVNKISMSFGLIPLLPKSADSLPSLIIYNFYQVIYEIINYY